MTSEIERKLRDWIILEGPRAADIGIFLAGIGERLLEAGVPVYRLTSGIPILHPLIRAESAVWLAGEGVTYRQFPRELENEEIFTNSPLYAVYKNGETVRVRVTPAPVPGEFGILEDLRAEGATDYIAFPLGSAGRTTKALTAATRRREGFAERDVAILQATLPPLGLIFELHSQRRAAQTLLGTYIGHRTAPRVLAGEIRRGDGQQIEAVIWFSDLRGFTDLSSTVTPLDLVDALDFYFESVTDPVIEQGGEVLKFVGDAVLAIFTFASEAESRDAADRALAAARTALANLQHIGDAHLAGTVKQLSVGISLHHGSVFYGNVGGRERLDFTVIGESVNVGSRINELCRDLGHPILASVDFVEYATEAFEEVGVYNLRGVRQPKRVYRPAMPAPALLGAGIAQSEISRP